MSGIFRMFSVSSIREEGTSKSYLVTIPWGLCVSINNLESGNQGNCPEHKIQYHCLSKDFSFCSLCSGALSSLGDQTVLGSDAGEHLFKGSLMTVVSSASY